MDAVGLSGVFLIKLRATGLLMTEMSVLAADSVAASGVLIRLAIGGYNPQGRSAPTPPAVTHWKKRFVAQGLAGLHDQAKTGRPRTHDDETIAELLSKILREAPSGSAHWSVRAAAEETGISKSSVARYFALFGVQPHRTKSFKLSKRIVRERASIDLQHPTVRRSVQPA